MIEPQSLSLTEWVVLGVISERPAYGFAVSVLTSDDGDWGWIGMFRALRSTGRSAGSRRLAWSPRKPSSRGAARSGPSTRSRGRAATRWTPGCISRSGMSATFARDLLMKLALLDRAGSDPADLLVLKWADLEPIVAAIGAERSSGEGFDAVLLAWRRATASAALSFLDDIMDGVGIPAAW